MISIAVTMSKLRKYKCVLFTIFSRINTTFFQKKIFFLYKLDIAEVMNFCFIIT